MTRDRSFTKVERVLVALVCATVVLPFLLFVADAFFLFELDSLGAPFLKLLSRSLVFGISEALASAFFSLALASALVLTLLSLKPAQRNFPERVLRNLGSLLFILPGTAIALLLFSLPTPVVEALEGWLLVVTAHVIWSAFFVASHVYERLADWLEAEGADLLKAARTMGASPAAGLSAVVLPLLKEEFRTWFPLIFLWSLGSFSTVLLLGSGPQHSTPEVLLYYTLNNDLDSTRLLILFAVSLSLQVFLLNFFTRSPTPPPQARLMLGADRSLARQRKQQIQLPARAVFLALSTVSLLFTLWLIAAQVSTILRGGVPDSGLWTGLLNSVSYAIISCVFCVALLLALAASTSKFRRRCLFLLALSPVLLATSWSAIGLGNAFTESGLARILLCSAALALLQLPFAALWIERSFSSLSSDTILYARSAGLSVSQIFWKIEVPYLRPVFEKLLTYTFCIAVGEIALASIWLKDWPLLSLASKRLAQSYDFHSASWLFVLTLASAVIARTFFRKILEKLFP